MYIRTLVIEEKEIKCVHVFVKVKVIWKIEGNEDGNIFLAAVVRLICISDEPSYFETVYMFGCYISNVYIASFIKQIKSKFSCVTEWTMHAYTCIDIWSDNLKKNASKAKFLS